MLKCLRRCSWSAWIVYHDWKLQIRKEIKEAESEKEKSYLSTDQYFGRISLLKNPIDTRLDGLEPWLKYLQLSSFEFCEILNFWRPKLTHNLLLKIWTKIKIVKVLFSLDTLMLGFWMEAKLNEFWRKKDYIFLSLMVA